MWDISVNLNLKKMSIWVIEICTAYSLSMRTQNKPLNYNNAKNTLSSDLHGTLHDMFMT